MWLKRATVSNLEKGVDIPLVRSLQHLTALSAPPLPAELDVGAPVPPDAPSGLIHAVVRQARDDARPLREQPARDVLGKHNLVPQEEPDCAGKEAHLVEVVGRDPICGDLAKKCNVNTIVHCSQTNYATYNSRPDEVEKHVPPAYCQPPQAERDARLLDLPVNVGLDVVLVLLHAELRPGKVSSDEERVREELEERGHLGERLRGLVLGELVLRPPAVVDVDGHADQAEAEHALWHRPRDVVAHVPRDQGTRVSKPEGGIGFLKLIKASY